MPEVGGFCKKSRTNDKVEKSCQVWQKKTGDHAPTFVSCPVLQAARPRTFCAAMASAPPAPGAAPPPAVAAPAAPRG